VLAGAAGLAVAAAAGATAAWWRGEAARRGPRPPNLVVILTDDQGLNDLGCYYTPPPGLDPVAKIDTPRLDRMAAEGVRLSTFYVAASLCTPSRAALLTGCYPPRVGFGAKDRGVGVLTPESRGGLAPEEVTVAEVLRDAGYRTGCFGKWHLGHQPPFRPTRQGFDEYFGIPWSNNQAPLVLIRGEEVVRRIDDTTPLTAPFTREALGFVARNADRPFFLYLAYSAPHEPLAVLPSFRGASARGRYGDAIAEVDHHVGLVLDALVEHGIADHTLVVFTSDNGPWLDGPPNAATGDAFPLRGGKGEPWEGGYRSPCLWWWPGTLPAGRVVAPLVTALDLLPTFARLGGAGLPAAPIDGHDAWPVVVGGAQSPTDAFYYYARGRLEAIRRGRFKRMFAVPIRTPPIEAALYDLEADPGETTDVAAAHPEVVAELDRLADAMRQRLGDDLRGVTGAEQRPIGFEPPA
ncbi:MAG: sulfatase, partial [Myxococcota bacterium]